MDDALVYEILRVSVGCVFIWAIIKAYLALNYEKIKDEEDGGNEKEESLGEEKPKT